MPSALWAGKRRTGQPARMKLSVGLGGADRGRPQAEFDYSADADIAYSYAIEIGLPMPTAAALPLEPQVKEETLLFHKSRRPLTVLDRRGPRATATDEDGKKQPLGAELLASETALGAIQDPARSGHSIKMASPSATRPSQSRSAASSGERNRKQSRWKTGPLAPW